MLMSRWSTFPDLLGDMDRFRSEMNQLFGRYGLEDGGWPALAYSYPPVNVWEDDDHVYAEAELPGMQLDHLEIYVTEGNQLTIQGERPAFEAGKGVWHRQERGHGTFVRVLTLPFEVNREKVEARLENGVLMVRLPKHEGAKPRKIAVKGE